MRRYYRLVTVVVRVCATASAAALAVLRERGDAPVRSRCDATDEIGLTWGR